ncbi:hypothetical protein Q9189_000598 [Teloschistes chrysophthalmus]
MPVSVAVMRRNAIHSPYEPRPRNPVGLVKFALPPRPPPPRELNPPLPPPREPLPPRSPPNPRPLGAPRPLPPPLPPRIGTPLEDPPARLGALK